MGERMSQSDVLDRVYERCLDIPGITAVHPNGRPFPEEEPPTTPCLVVDLMDSRPETAVLSGNKWHRYEVLLTVYLGPPDLTVEQAQAIALPVADAVLSVFGADPFLTATCFNSDVSEVARNLDTYQQDGRCPKAQAILAITEYV